MTPYGRGTSMRVLTGRVARWPVWNLPPQLLVAVLVVEATALVALGAAAFRIGVPPAAQIVPAALLVVLGIGHTEIVARAERTRRRIVTDVPHVDLNSVWTFAAAVVVAPHVAAVVAIAVQTHAWLRTGRPHIRAYRTVFSISTVVLSCLGAAVVVAGLAARPSGLPYLLELGLALLVYTTINSALVGGAVAMSSPQPSLAAFAGGWFDNLLEIATLSLGALVALGLQVGAPLVVLVLPPMLVLHRAVLVRRLEEAASTDAKTGLLNAATWHLRAARALRRTGRGLQAVLVLDLDHFKTVNDTYGHLAGDHVLAAVADLLRVEVRDRDLVGRFGGEEFVVFLAGLDGGTQGELEAVAERIRRRIAGLRVEIPTADGPLTIAGLTVSVGGAVHPGGDGVDLTALMRVADSALYAAKRAGRNLVRMGVVHPHEPATPVPTVLPTTGGSDAE